MNEHIRYQSTINRRQLFDDYWKSDKWKKVNKLLLEVRECILSSWLTFGQFKTQIVIEASSILRTSLDFEITYFGKCKVTKKTF